MAKGNALANLETTDFIPITLMGKITSVGLNNGKAKDVVNIWCGFYDMKVKALCTAYARVSGIDNFDFVHNFSFGKTKAVKDYQGSPRLELDTRTRKKRAEGFESVAGNWYLSPDVGGILNLTQLQKVFIDKMTFRRVALNGFATANSNGNTVNRTTGLTDPRIAAARKLHERLGEVNPVGNSWFFAL